MHKWKVAYKLHKVLKLCRLVDVNVHLSCQYDVKGISDIILDNWVDSFCCCGGGGGCCGCGGGVGCCCGCCVAVVVVLLFFVVVVN